MSTMGLLNFDFTDPFGFGSMDPNAIFGQNNAPMGQGQGPWGIPTGYSGALLGGDPLTSVKSSGNTGGMQPSPQKGWLGGTDISPWNKNGLGGTTGHYGDSVQPPAQATPAQNPIGAVLANTDMSKSSNLGLLSPPVGGVHPLIGMLIQALSGNAA